MGLLKKIASAVTEPIAQVVPQVKEIIKPIEAIEKNPIEGTLKYNPVSLATNKLIEGAETVPGVNQVYSFANTATGGFGDRVKAATSGDKVAAAQVGSTVLGVLGGPSGLDIDLPESLQGIFDNVLNSLGSIKTPTAGVTSSGFPLTTTSGYKAGATNNNTTKYLIYAGIGAAVLGSIIFYIKRKK